ncbi:hypothetical protein I588_05195 [Enterococcus pallens ATCC BAA-351]|uniref:Uncharacterized protein n=1 Tax=Enterococcus pallens ATCC BAA-351 TaxID=1158607 RepID=R2PP71_9ENTE|nr:hypothetical protein UAU_05239 [Enterococcus pallens ATCC BAA-351]EOU09462.1 hypothetical protein I588_05195 [Enterococcus pallens ATCC BAA-351]
MSLLFLFILWLTACCVYVRKDSEALIVHVLYSLLCIGLIISCFYSLIVERDLSYFSVILMSVIVLIQDGSQMIVELKGRYHSWRKES